MPDFRDASTIPIAKITASSLSNMDTGSSGSNTVSSSIARREGSRRMASRGRNNNNNNTEDSLFSATTTPSTTTNFVVRNTAEEKNRMNELNKAMYHLTDIASEQLAETTLLETKKQIFS
jgi:hypothetical protein